MPIKTKDKDSNTAEERLYLEYTSTKCLKHDVMAADKYGYMAAGINKVERRK